MLTLELKVIVIYNPNGVPTETLKENLERLVSIGMGDGLLTGSTEAEVKTWSSSVKEV